MEEGHWSFNNGNRSPKDGKWFVAYCGTMIVTAATGLLAWSNMNPHFHRAISDSTFMDNPKSCDAEFPGRRLLDANEDFAEAYGWILLKAVLYSIVPALAIGGIIIHLFRKIPHTMINVGFSIAVIYFAAMSAFIGIGAGRPLVAAIIFVPPALVLLYIYFRFRTKLQLVGRLMKVACDSLAANPSLVPFALGANLSVIPALLALGAVIFALQGNGGVEQNAGAIELQDTQCFDDEGVQVACCAWKTAGWVRPMQIAVAIVFMWTDAIVAQLRTYVMGGVITQWYFHEETRGTIPRSLRHALGPARGTLCFSAAVITVCNMIREFVNRARTDRSNPVFIIVGCLFSWLIDMIQEAIRFISTLATIQAAATGEAFLDAARSVGAMLSRHSLSAVAVWWLPQMVLSMTLLAVAVSIGTATYFIALAAWQGSNRHDAFMDAIILAEVVAFTFAILTGWLLGFIRSTTDAVYVCFARDLDNRAVTRPEVHAVLKEVPAASGAVVVQPDDNLVYGAMEEGGSPTAPLIPPQPEPAPARDLTAAIEASPEEAPEKGGK